MGPVYLCIVTGEVVLDGSTQGSLGRGQILRRSDRFLSNLVIQIPECCFGKIGVWKCKEKTSKNNKQKKRKGATELPVSSPTI